MIKSERPQSIHKIDNEGHKQSELVVTLDDPRSKDVQLVGGKSASLAKLREVPGIDVPEAFVITTALYDQVIESNPHLKDVVEELDKLSHYWIESRLQKDNQNDSLNQQIIRTGNDLRTAIQRIEFPRHATDELVESYRLLCDEVGEKDLRVSVRSSGIAEDLGTMSFAGQYDTYLNQRGDGEVLDAVKNCLASQFTERVNDYRNKKRLEFIEKNLEEKSIDKLLLDSSVLAHGHSKLAIITQRMVNAASSGVGFTIDSTTGAPVMCLNVSYGLGEAIVSGSVNPDAYKIDPRTGEIVERVLGSKHIKTSYNGHRGTDTIQNTIEEQRRFALPDRKIHELAALIANIKEAYGHEVDVEFLWDAEGKPYFLQSRPETVASQQDKSVILMKQKRIPDEIAKNSVVLFEGGTTGSPGVAIGKIKVANDREGADEVLEKGDILVAPRTDPDWEPVMEKTDGIVTDMGGANCHAAIVTREAGIPSIVGTGGGTHFFKDFYSSVVTLDANEKRIYEGALPLEEVGENINIREILKNPPQTTIGLVISKPEMAGKMHGLSELGDKFKISLLRSEFLRAKIIGVHDRALEAFDKGEIEHGYLREQIEEKIAGFESGKDYFVTQLSEGYARFAALFPESEITIRTCDFKTNEYENLLGGDLYEKPEANPMMGWRGLIRSLAPENREIVKWELEAIKRARDMGYKNIQVMFPIVRDPRELTGSEELDRIGFKGIYEIMHEVGMERGEVDLETVIMVEVPSNVNQIDEFLRAGLDGISFGTNDLTQFTLAVDRDNELLSKIPWYSESNPAIVESVRHVIRRCKKYDVKTGVCGNAPSNDPSFVQMLISEGIDSIGVMPDRYLPTYKLVKNAELTL